MAQATVHFHISTVIVRTTGATAGPADHMAAVMSDKEVISLTGDEHIVQSLPHNVPCQCPVFLTLKHITECHPSNALLVG